MLLAPLVSGGHLLGDAFPVMATTGGFHEGNILFPQQEKVSVAKYTFSNVCHGSNFKKCEKQSPYQSVVSLV